MEENPSMGALMFEEKIIKNFYRKVFTVEKAKKSTHKYLNILYFSSLFSRLTLTAEKLQPAALVGAHLGTLRQITAIRVLVNLAWRRCIQTPP